MYTYISEMNGSIIISGYDENGKKFNKRTIYPKTTIWHESLAKTDIISFPEFSYLRAVEYNNLNDFYQAKKYSEKKTYGAIHNAPIVQHIVKGKHHENFDALKLRIAFIDIEVFSLRREFDPNRAVSPITSLSWLERGADRFHVWTLYKDYDSIHWFKERHKNFKSYKSFLEIEEFLERETTKEIETVTKRIDDIKKEIQDRKDSYIKSDEYPDIYFYLQEPRVRLKSEEIFLLRAERTTKDFHRAVNMEVHTYEDEKIMLDDFATFVGQSGIDVITAWNGDGFDFPYIANRIRRIAPHSLRKLSPLNIVNDKTYTLFKVEYCSMNIAGITVLDYLALDKKYTQNKRASYKLEEVGQSVVGWGKVDYDGDLNELWLKDKDQYVTYNLGDVEVMEAIDGVLDYMNLLYNIVHYTASAPMDFANPSYIWEALLFKDAMQYNMVIPSSTGGGMFSPKKESIRGAFVRDVKLGITKWVMSVDLQALYPSIIRMMNMSHETLTGKDRKMDEIESMVAGTFDASPWKNKNECITPFGTSFSKEREGFITSRITALFKQRKENKKRSLAFFRDAQEAKTPSEYESLHRHAIGLQGRQMAEKTLLNAFYGAMQVGSFALFDKDIAEAITTTGQVMNRFSARRLNEEFNKTFKTKDREYIIAGDTDSHYIDVGEFVKDLDGVKSDDEIIDYLDYIGNKVIDPLLVKIFDEAQDYFGVYQKTMLMEREAIARGAFWKGKKMYAMLVHDMEGQRYPEPKLYIKGIKIIRSDTPEKVKPILSDFLYRAILGVDLGDFIVNAKEDIMGWSVEDISSPQTIHKFLKYYQPNTKNREWWSKGAGANVRGGARYNALLKELNLLEKYEQITDESRVMFVWLKEDNRYLIPSISYIEKLPNEFGLRDNIDTLKQYHKIAGKFFNDVVEVIGVCNVNDWEELF